MLEEILIKRYLMRKIINTRIFVTYRCSMACLYYFKIWIQTLPKCDLQIMLFYSEIYISLVYHESCRRHCSIAISLFHIQKSFILVRGDYRQRSYLLSEPLQYGMHSILLGRVLVKKKEHLLLQAFPPFLATFVFVFLLAEASPFLLLFLAIY